MMTLDDHKFFSAWLLAEMEKTRKRIDQHLHLGQVSNARQLEFVAQFLEDQRGHHIRKIAIMSQDSAP